VSRRRQIRAIVKSSASMVSRPDLVLDVIRSAAHSVQESLATA
jgi:hypothetical protein